MRNFRQRKAFTIVEMVIVIAVIAVLAAVMIPTISGVIKKANHSADTQFAASLSMQLATWEADPANGVIDSEEKLREAMEAFYDADFYDTLAPKSGKDGYHYWYDVESKKVILATYAELAGEIETYATGEITFSPASIRSLLISNKNYFLLDKGGSDLIDAMKALENAVDSGDYGEKLQQLLATAAENALATKIAGKLANTAIANANGVFFSEETGTVNYVYVPYGTETIGASRIPDGATIDVEEIQLPDSITQIGTGSLTGFKRVEADEYMEGSTTIYANTTEDELKNNNFVATDAFDCVLQLPTGDRYAFVDSVLTKLGSTTTFPTNYSVDLDSFTVSVPADANKKYDLHTYDDGTRPLHYTSDFTGSITLTADDFKDTNGDYVARTAVWTVGGASTTANTLTLDKDALDANTQIKVVAQNLEYTIDIVKVSIHDFTTSVGGVNGNPNQDDGELSYTATLEYKAGTTWKVSANVTLSHPLSCVEMSTDVSLSLLGTGASKLTIDGDTLKVKDGVSGDFDAIVVITTKGTDGEGSKLSNQYHLNFKQASSTFAIADNADTQTKYGIKFTVGTVQPIKLGTLFKLVEGEANNVVVTWSNNGSAATPFTFNSQTGDWTEWEITPGSAGENFAISISDGGATCTLNVKVVSGAYNVATYDQWVSASSKICLLADIALGNNFDTQNKTLTYMFGNMHVIDASQFNYKHATHTNCYLIKMTSGTFDSTVIVGPVYPESVLSGDSGSTGDGYFAPGLRLSGTVTVSNSYISGFFAPIRVDGGTITIKNTTLDGGINSNVHIYNGISVTLEDCVTIQRRGGYTETYTGKNNKVVGAAIFCDTKADGTNIVLKGNTQQYNWLSENDNYGDTVGIIIDYLFKSSKDCDGNKTFTYDDFVHNVDGVNYVNMGVAQEKRGLSVTVDTSSLDNTYTTSYDKVVEEDGTKAFGSYISSGAAIWSTKKCNSCTHIMDPDDLTGDGVYTYLDFIAGRKVN